MAKRVPRGQQPTISVGQLDHISFIESGFVNPYACYNRKIVKLIDELSRDSAREMGAVRQVTQLEESLYGRADVSLGDYLAEALFMRLNSLSSHVPEWGERRIQRYAIVAIKLSILPDFEKVRKNLERIRTDYLFSRELIESKRALLQSLRSLLPSIEQLSIFDLRILLSNPSFITSELFYLCPDIASFLRANTESAQMLVYLVRSQMEDTLRRRESYLQLTSP